jgi:hypothetical protein
MDLYLPFSLFILKEWLSYVPVNQDGPPKSYIVGIQHRAKSKKGKDKLKTYKENQNR